jgi:hypothetical protein
MLVCVALGVLAGTALSQDAGPAAKIPASDVLPLYRDLRTVPFDPKQVYKIREATLDRDDLHIFLNDGIVIFTKEVDGRVTGMYFDGDGELLVRPPNRTEKESLGLFTNLGVLDDHFSHAYFRFNDDVKTELKSSLLPPGDVDLTPVVQQEQAAEQLADVDALRLLTWFTGGDATDEKGRKLISDHFLHARIGGSHFGSYDVFYDTRAPEQIFVGQMAEAEGYAFYDLWMSFASRSVRTGKADGVVPLRAADSLHADSFKIDASVLPPSGIAADADLDLKVRQGGPRLLFFELSHELHLKSVTLNDAPVLWLQNEALEGTQLARRGNDFVAVVLPEPCKAGEELHLHFQYEGSVLADAGNGLLYVGAHGIWYPNRGLTPSQYELDFSYPRTWTLLAVGEKVTDTQSGDMRKSRWISDRPVPVAGFNLGRYAESKTSAGGVEIAAYASRGVEKDFPIPQKSELRPVPDPWRGPQIAEITTPLTINPAERTKAIADDAKNTVEFYDSLLGPYPFSSLKITQFPGPDSQGWPGLIYLSSYTFLTPEQRQQLGLSDFLKAFFGTLMLRHEVAHMWWGHEVFWDTYRDQWLLEALANYSAILMTEGDHPELEPVVLLGYRDQLLSKRYGRDLFDAGPVTLGMRLNSAKFPDAYLSIAYGRGTWLVHMLRCMLDDAAKSPRGRTRISGDDLFIQVLRKLLADHQNSAVSTADFIHAFEAVLPEPVRFEGRKSLDWFYDGWVNGTSVPAIDVTGVKFTKQGEEQFVSGDLHQKYAPDDLVTSVPLYVQTAEKLEYVGRVFAVGAETHFRLRTKSIGRKLVVDPYHTVLRRP